MDQAPNRPAQTILLGVDRQVSVLHALGARGRSESTYCVFGFDPREASEHPLLRFNEQIKEAPGFYLLGCGYRAYNPVLRVFQSPDSWSPFGTGGLNAYAYCGLDPVNNEDRTGHATKKVTSLPRLPTIFEGRELLVPVSKRYVDRVLSKVSVEALPREVKAVYDSVDVLKSKLKELGVRLEKINVEYPAVKRFSSGGEVIKYSDAARDILRNKKNLSLAINQKKEELYHWKGTQGLNDLKVIERHDKQIRKRVVEEKILQGMPDIFQLPKLARVIRVLFY